MKKITLLSFACLTGFSFSFTACSSGEKHDSTSEQIMRDSVTAAEHAHDHTHGDSTHSHAHGHDGDTTQHTH